MIVETFTQRFIKCPNGCDHEFNVEHIFNRQIGLAGPWHCDVCCQEWMVYIKENDIIELEKRKPDKYSDGKVYKCWSLLKIPSQKKDIILKIKDNYYIKNDIANNKKYFYEEHTCPENIFRMVHEVYIGEDDDPHGLAEYIGSFPIETQIDISNIEKYMNMSFMDKLLNGYKHNDDLFNDEVYKWHELDCDTSLHEFLGMTREEFDKYSVDSSYINVILKNRTKND